MPAAVDLNLYLRRLWTGSVTAPQNVRWFVPLWAWFGLVVWASLRHASSTVPFITFWLVAIASTIPFFCRRVGLIRLWLFVWVLPRICAALVIQIVRTVFHLS
jgi:hypothetical protein